VGINTVGINTVGINTVGINTVGINTVGNRVEVFEQLVVRAKKTSGQGYGGTLRASRFIA
jgi:hypothetical protein